MERKSFFFQTAFRSNLGRGSSRGLAGDEGGAAFLGGDAARFFEIGYHLFRDPFRGTVGGFYDAFGVEGWFVGVVDSRESL